MSRKKWLPEEELSKNWVPVPSKSHPNKIYYFNKLSKKSTWTNPCKEIENNRGLPSKPQDVTCVRNSRKRRIQENLDVEDTIEIIYKSAKNEVDYVKGSQSDIKSSIKSSLTDCKSLNREVTHLKDYSGNKGKFKNYNNNNNNNNINNNNEKGSDFPKLHDNVASTYDRVPQIQSREYLYPRKQIKSPSVGNVPCFQKSKKTLELINGTGNLEEEYADITDYNPGSNLSFYQESCSTQKRYGSGKIKDRLNNNIKADKKFQERLRKLIAQTGSSCNKNLINEDLLKSDEEMDWEPSDQEVMIEHIKNLRRNLDPTEVVSNEFIMYSTTNSGKDSDYNNLILVFDTNIFISCLMFVREIRDTYIPGLDLPTTYIPWRVLNELDHLKNAENKQIQESAIRAIRYINGNFACGHPRVKGQSFEDFCSMDRKDCACADDEILRICLNLTMAAKERTVILITNDRNLENKALVSNVEAYSKKRFMEEKMNHGDDKIASFHMSRIREQWASYPKLKYILKYALQQVLETELIKAFDEDWLKVVVKKPPWTLMEVLECFIKHWRSVFTFVFGKDVQSLIEDLKGYFLTEENFKDTPYAKVVQMSLELLNSLRNPIHKRRTIYEDVLDASISNIESLIKAEKNLIQEQEMRQLPTSSFLARAPASPLELQRVSVANTPVFDSQHRREKVKALFQAIWDQIKHFSDKISELVLSNGMTGPDIVYQVKCQFPHVMQKLRELIETLERIISLEPEVIVQSSQLIINFTKFLIGLNVFPIEASDTENLSESIGFFCCDNESRSVLCVLLNDLKKFASEMMEGVKFLGFL